MWVAVQSGVFFRLSDRNSNLETAQVLKKTMLDNRVFLTQVHNIRVALQYMCFDLYIIIDLHYNEFKNISMHFNTSK